MWSQQPNGRRSLELHMLTFSFFWKVKVISRPLLLSWWQVSGKGMILNLVFKYAILTRGMQCHTVALPFTIKSNACEKVQFVPHIVSKSHR
jgi:hypothetical protein